MKRAFIFLVSFIFITGLIYGQDGWDNNPDKDLVMSLDNAKRWIKGGFEHYGKKNTFPKEIYKVRYDSLNMIIYQMGQTFDKSNPMGDTTLIVTIPLNEIEIKELEYISEDKKLFKIGLYAKGLKIHTDTEYTGNDFTDYILRIDEARLSQLKIYHMYFDTDDYRRDLSKDIQVILARLKKLSTF